MAKKDSQLMLNSMQHMNAQFTKMLTHKEGEQIEEIRYDLLSPSEQKDLVDNRSADEDSKLQALAQDIFSRGLKVPLRVFQRGREYSILSGNRRYAAIGMLRELRDAGRLEGAPDPQAIDSRSLDLISCIVEPAPETEDERMLSLIRNNLQREKTGWTKVQEIIITRDILLRHPDLEVRDLWPGDEGAPEEPRKEEEEPRKKGKRAYREKLADLLGVSQSVITRAISIHDNLIPEFMEAFQEDRISMHAAGMLAGEMEKDQRLVYDSWDRETRLTPALVTRLLGHGAEQKVLEAEEHPQEEAGDGATQSAGSEEQEEQGQTGEDTPPIPPPENLEEGLRQLGREVDELLSLARPIRSSRTARKSEARMLEQISKEMARLAVLKRRLTAHITRYGLDPDQEG